MSVVDAVQRDLERLGGDLADSALAASALTLARELDKSGNSATSKSMCAKALMETMDRLRQLAPPKEVRDGVSDIAAARERRRAGLGGAGA
jgi:hypothetical protein